MNSRFSGGMTTLNTSYNQCTCSRVRTDIARDTAHESRGQHPRRDAEQQSITRAPGRRESCQGLGTVLTSYAVFTGSPSQSRRIRTDDKLL